MHNQLYFSILILAVTACLTGLGCRAGLEGVASCGLAEESCELPSCGYAEESCELPSCGYAEESCELPSCGLAEESCELPSCGYADEPCELPSCGLAEESCELPSCGLAEESCELPSCGLAEEPCDTIGCCDGVGSEQQSCGWLKKLLGCFKWLDCDGCGGELYWSEWHNDPPGCEPCDSCGNWIGPPGVYRAPYRTLPGLATEPRTAPMNEQAAEFLVPEEGFEQDDLTYEYEQTPREVLKLSLERETYFR